MGYLLVDENEYYSEHEYHENIETVEFGAGRTYYVLLNDQPCLRIMLENAYFHDIILFQNHIYIGKYTDGLYIIDLKDNSFRNIEIEGYFAYFRRDRDALYVLGCCNVMAFDQTSKLIWTSANIAIDGISFDHIDKDIMYVKCEMDPPGGWIERKIDLPTGQPVL